MPTLYVENVPDDLYEALRERARRNRASIASEVIALLTAHVPTAKDLAARRAFFKQALKFRAQPPAAPGRFPTTEEMQREDHAR